MMLEDAIDVYSDFNPTTLLPQQLLYALSPRIVEVVCMLRRLSSGRLNAKDAQAIFA